MENQNNGFFQGQVNALKDVYKNTDANEVLNKILEKIQSFEGFASGTELGDTLSGISNLAKNITAPFKSITSGWNSLQKSFKDFGKLQNENNDEKPEKEIEVFPDNDYAKDDQIIDLGDHLKSLINKEDHNFELLEERIGEQKYFLEDISSTVGSLIYGTDAIVDQLRKNQKNTKVFQVSKKEMTLAEKAELGQSATQIGLLQQIKDNLVQLDTDLNEDLADAIQQNKDDLHVEPDADFIKEPPEEKPDNKDEKIKEDSEKDNQNRALALLTSISKSIFQGTKFLLQMARAAVVAAVKTTLIIGGILTALVAIDFLQALIRTKQDELVEWFDSFRNWLGDKWDKFKESMAQFFQNYIEKPFDVLIYWNKQLDAGIVKLGATILEGIANIVSYIPGSGDADQKLMRIAEQMRTDADLDLQKRWDEFAKKNGEDSAKELLGNRDEVREYKMDESSKDNLSKQAEEDKDNKTQVVELKDGLKVSVNQDTKDLEEALRQYQSQNDEVAKQNREIIENLLSVKKQRDEYVKEKTDDKEFSWLRTKWNELWDNEEENKKNQKEVQELKDQATKDFNEEYLKDGIKIDSGEKIKSQISEKERQEYDLYDPNMQMYRAQQDFLASQKKEQKNNVQVNNQNNNTNIINQPLTTANPLNHKRSRTNIGQE